MKKEILFAIFIGLSLGLIITYGAYRARKSEQEMATQTTDSIASETIDQEKQGNQLLTLFSPDDETLQNTDKVKIAGSTEAGSFVVIFINDDESITNADDSGNFALEGKLEKGSNVISVHAINEDGKVAVEERVLIYTTVDITAESKESSPSGEKE